MRRLLPLLALSLLAALLYAGYRGLTASPEAPSGEVQLANGARLSWTTCWFEVPEDRPTHCAWFHPASSAGEQAHRLPVVVFRHSGLDHRPSPVLYLAGGPGGGAWIGPEQIEGWYYWLEEVDWPHDFVVFDQRGTGMAQPRPDCQELDVLYADMLDDPLPPAEAAAAGLAAATRCHRRLSAAGHDLAAYSTPANARDARDLMAALDQAEGQPAGAARWNLYGVSYGTRLAMEIQRRHPERVRSAILDSVYPPEMDATLTWPGLLQGAMERLFTACESDPGCRERHPRLREHFPALLARLARQPVDLSLPHPYEEEPVQLRVNDERLLYVLFDSLYQWDAIGGLPAALDALWRGDSQRLEPLAARHVGSVLDPSFSDAVYLSVECHDARPFDRQAYLDAVHAHPLSAPYTAAAADADVCASWPAARAPEDFYEPVRSSLPTLLLAGEMDPVTPADWAETAARGYPNGTLLRFPGIGHSVLDSDACAVTLARRFLANPRRAPRADCMHNLSPVEFAP